MGNEPRDVPDPLREEHERRERLRQAQARIDAAAERASAEARRRPSLFGRPPAPELRNHALDYMKKRQQRAAKSAASGPDATVPAEQVAEAPIAPAATEGAAWPSEGKVPFETIARSRSGPDEAGYFLVESEQDYLELFRGKPPSKVTVDFESELVLGVAMGVQDEAFVLEIRRVAYASPTAKNPTPRARVEVSVTRDAKDGRSSTQSRPFHVIKMKRFEAEFVFREAAIAAKPPSSGANFGFALLSLFIPTGRRGGMASKIAVAEALKSTWLKAFPRKGSTFAAGDGRLRTRGLPPATGGAAPDDDDEP